MHKQFDSVPMGTPFGPTLANICVGFHKSRLFDNTIEPSTFDLWTMLLPFLVPSWIVTTKEKLKLLLPALEFIVEKEQNTSLNFLDVLVEKEGTGFLTTIYRKPTFTGQYIPTNQKSCVVYEFFTDVKLGT